MSVIVGWVIGRGEGEACGLDSLHFGFVLLYGFWDGFLGFWGLFVGLG